MKYKYITQLLFCLIFLFLCTACGTKTSAEKEQYPDVFLESGIYTFYNESADKYLSYREKQLVLGNQVAEWCVEVGVDEDVYFYAGDTGLLMDIDNAVMAEGTMIKIWNFTGNAVQRWKIKENSNGTYTFLSSSNTGYCLGFQDEDAVLQIRDEQNVMQEWTAVKVREIPKNYTSFEGEEGIVELRLPLDITRVITESRLQKWANDLETAYHSFYELTNYKPYDTIIVEGYKSCEYTGYVVSGSNIIHIDCDFLYEDLTKMAARENDWNFCALHEMGHLFHHGRPWDFESEMMTDLEVAYVLETNGAEAAPAEFPIAESFCGKEIMNAYKRLSKDFSREYDIFGFVHRFLQIKEEIGWEPFKETFHELQEHADEYTDASPKELFEKFVSLLSSYGHIEIQEYFSAEEWETINRTLKNEK